MVMTRPRADQLSHVATLLNEIPTWTRIPGLVLIGDGYSRVEVERELRVPVMGTLPDDAAGAAPLCGQQRGRSPEKSALGRAAERLARNLVAHVQHAPTSDIAHAPAAVPAQVPSSGNGVVPR